MKPKTRSSGDDDSILVYDFRFLAILRPDIFDLARRWQAMIWLLIPGEV